ncbi:MAG: ornithine cyclodeaminase family protein [Ruminococcaceae bacterium]|nr:ornithine cyclodeaminase family protein [Oscillospiraceae bacterium]
MDSLIITNKMVQKYVSIEDVIECVENTWKWYGEKNIVMPSKITTDMSSLGVNGWFNSMPSYIHPLNSAGIKVVGGYSDNPKNNLPFIRANLLLTDPSNGDLKALMCGDWISDARTGAQPAVAMKYLAAKSDVITVIGAGRQAYYSIECIRRTHKIGELRVCDIRPEAREGFAKYFPDADFKITPYESIEEACKESDVIITLTTADAVLVEEPWCKKGCLVLPMGSFHEVDDDIARKFDKIYLDNIAQGMHRGQFLNMAHTGEITAESFDAELPDVVAGIKKGRDNSEQRIICQLVGMGCPDLAVATLAYNRIVASGEEVVSVDMIG